MPAHHAKKSSGFTLLELLVVVIIIVISTLFIVPQINLGDNNQRLKDEAERMAVIVAAVRQEAILKFKTFVLQVYPNNYQFLALEETSGLMPMEDKLFAPREMPGDIYMKAALENNEMLSLDNIAGKQEDENAQSTETTKDKTDQPEPILNVIIFASGEMSPFTLQMLNESGGEYEVVGGITGTVEVVDPRAT